MKHLVAATALLAFFSASCGRPRQRLVTVTPSDAIESDESVVVVVDSEQRETSLRLRVKNLGTEPLDLRAATVQIVDAKQRTIRPRKVHGDRIGPGQEGAIEIAFNSGLADGMAEVTVTPADAEPWIVLVDVQRGPTGDGKAFAGKVVTGVGTIALMGGVLTLCALYGDGNCNF